MNREKAKEQFLEEAERTLRPNANIRFAREFRASFSAFREKLLEGFEKVCTLVKEEETISLIQISWLRTGIMDGSYQWYIEAQGSEGVFDPTERAVSFSMKEFFSAYEELEETLIEKLKQYETLLMESDVKQYKLQAAEDCRMYLETGCMQVFREIQKHPAYQKLQKTPLFRIVFGEYKGKIQFVHITEEEVEKEELQKEFFREILLEKEEEEEDKMLLQDLLPESKIREQLKQAMQDNNSPFANRKADFENPVLTRRDFTWITIEKQTICLRSLFYSLFSGISIRNSTFLYCNLIGADFQKAEVENSYFHICTMQNACMEEGIFRQTSFAGSFLGIEEEEEQSIAICGVSFRNAVLEKVSFAYADVTGCDFRGAVMQEVQFHGAKMNKSLWDRETLTRVELTREQKAELIIEEQG